MDDFLIDSHHVMVTGVRRSLIRQRGQAYLISLFGIVKYIEKRELVFPLWQSCIFLIGGEWNVHGAL